MIVHDALQATRSESITNSYPVLRPPPDVLRSTPRSMACVMSRSAVSGEHLAIAAHAELATLNDYPPVESNLAAAWMAARTRG
jgi:hypothetical protein